MVTEKSSSKEMPHYIRGLSRKYPTMYYEKQTVIEEDTRYKKHCTQDNDTGHLKTGTLGPHRLLPASLPLFRTLRNPLLESPSAFPLYFPECYQWSEISSFSKVILFLGNLVPQILFIGSGLNQVISNCSMMFLPLQEQKPQNRFCKYTFRAKILRQNLRHSSFWNPQVSF